MRVFVLEDNEYRGPAIVQWFEEEGHEVVLATRYAEAIKILDEQPRFEEMSLDHGLEMDYHSGTDVARHVVAMPKEKQPSKVWVHSGNPAGARDIVAVLKAGGIEAVAAPRY